MNFIKNTNNIIKSKAVQRTEIMDKTFNSNDDLILELINYPMFEKLTFEDCTFENIDFSSLIVENCMFRNCNIIHSITPEYFYLNNKVSTSNFSEIKFKNISNVILNNITTFNFNNEVILK